MYGMNGRQQHLHRMSLERGLNRVINTPVNQSHPVDTDTTKQDTVEMNTTEQDAVEQKIEFNTKKGKYNGK